MIKTNKLHFFANEIYLVDDDKTIFLWFGREVGLNKQDITVKKARKLNKDRGGRAKLLLMNQGREYGTFSAMMDDLKKGIKEEEVIERRPELDLKEPKKVLKAIEEKAPEVELGVVQWLEQLKTYRKTVILNSIPEPKEEVIVPEPKEEVIIPELKEEVIIPEAKEEVIIPEPKEEAIIPETKEEPYMPIKVEPKLHVPSNLERWLIQLMKYRTEAQKEIISDVPGVKETIPEDFKIIMEESVEQVEEKIEVDFETLVNVGAFYLSKRGFTYDQLCWILSEKHLNIQKSGNVSEEEIREKAEEVFNTSCTYDELCWLIAELDTIVAQKYFDEF